MRIKQNKLLLDELCCKLVDKNWRYNASEHKKVYHYW